MEAVEGITPLLFGTVCELGAVEVAYIRILSINLNAVQRLTSSVILLVKETALELGRTRAGRRVKSPLDDEI